MTRKLYKSFACAISGLKAIWRTERNFRIQIAVAAVLVVGMYWLKFSYTEAIAVVIAIMFVLIAEGLNTVVEKILDRVEPKQNPVVGRIKDMMAGMVLIASLGALVIGSLTFWRHFLI